MPPLQDGLSGYIQNKIGEYLNLYDELSNSMIINFRAQFYIVKYKTFQFLLMKLQRNKIFKKELAYRGLPFKNIEARTFCNKIMFRIEPIAIPSS